MAFTSPEETAAVLSSPLFGQRLVEVTDTTADTGAEAGFAVYKLPEWNAAGISDVLHPDDNYLDALADVEARLRRDLSGTQLSEFMEQVIEGGEGGPGHDPALNIGRLITDSGFDQSIVSDADAESVVEAPMRMRSDLAVVTHSHPLIHLRNRDPKKFLLPSAADLISYGDQMAASPGVMNATTTTHTKLGGTALFIWRGTSAETQANLQALPQGANITEERIAQLGLKTATLTYNRHTGKVRSGLERIPGLF